MLFNIKSSLRLTLLVHTINSYFILFNLSGKPPPSSLSTMASLMFTASTSPLVHVHTNTRNSVFLPRRCINQIRLHNTPSIRGCSVSSSSQDTGFTRIDGKKDGKSIIDEIKIEVSRMDASIHVVPGLAVILVGDRKDSASYVRNKKNACDTVGIKSVDVCLPEDSSEEEVLKYVLSFNNDPSIHGILVQLPLPSVRCFLPMLLIFIVLSY